MRDRIDLFFRGGLRIHHSAIDGKVFRRIMRRLARGNRLPFTGEGIAIITARAAQRAKGAGIEEGVVISKAIRKSLVAAGLSWKEAKGIKWVSIWD